MRQFFKESEIPYDQFEKIGLTKMDVLTLDKTNLELLMSGNRSKLIPIKGFFEDGKPFDMESKISLNRDADGRVNLILHPIREKINNEIGLKDLETERLQNSQSIVKIIEGQKYLVQLDKETNELLKVKLKEIKVPSHIKDVELSSMQKENLKNGLPITIESGKEVFQVTIDLNDIRGLKFTDESFDMKQKLEFDRAHPEIVGTLQTDQNRGEFLEYQKEHQRDNKDNDFVKKANNIFDVFSDNPKADQGEKSDIKFSSKIKF